MRNSLVILIHRLDTIDKARREEREKKAPFLILKMYFAIKGCGRVRRVCVGKSNLAVSLGQAETQARIQLRIIARKASNMEPYHQILFT